MHQRKMCAYEILRYSITKYYLDFKNAEMKPLLEWEFVQRRFPWGVILLLGGGYALSKGAKAAGLNELIGQSLKSLSHLSPSLIQLSCMTIIGFVTEVTSNTGNCLHMWLSIGSGYQ